MITTNIKPTKEIENKLSEAGVTFKVDVEMDTNFSKAYKMSPWLQMNRTLQMVAFKILSGAGFAYD